MAKIVSFICILRAYFFTFLPPKMFSCPIPPPVLMLVSHWLYPFHNCVLVYYVYGFGTYSSCPVCSFHMNRTIIQHPSTSNPIYRLNTYPFRAAPYKLSYDNWPASAAVLVHCVVPWTCCCCLLYWLRFLTPPSANLHSKGSSCPTQNEKELYIHTG